MNAEVKKPIEEALASVETVRKLVRIVTLDDVIPHPNADRLDIAIVGGWQCVIKRDILKKGDQAIYCEIDSLLPITNPYFAFLEDLGVDIKQVGDQSYARIKTIKLRKELSQGLVIPIPKEDLSKLLSVASSAEAAVSDHDLTGYFNVLKYEGKPRKVHVKNPKELTLFQRFVDWVRGPELEAIELPWPSFLKKSDQERVQNIHNAYGRCVDSGELFEATVKLDGASMTAYRVTHNGELHVGVCKRNAELKQTDTYWPWHVSLRYFLASLIGGNRRMFRLWRFYIPKWKRGTLASEDEYVRIYRQLDLEGRLKRFSELHGMQIAVQGELVGPGIQDNFEGLSELRFFVYDVYILNDLRTGTEPRKLLPLAAKSYTEQLGLEYVPVLDEATTLPLTVKECLTAAEGPGYFKNGKGFREGVVYKSITRNFSFKAISNSYLLKVEE